MIWFKTYIAYYIMIAIFTTYVVVGDYSVNNGKNTRTIGLEAWISFSFKEIFSLTQLSFLYGYQKFYLNDTTKPESSRFNKQNWRILWISHLLKPSCSSRYDLARVGFTISWPSNANWVNNTSTLAVRICSYLTRAWSIEESI